MLQLTVTVALIIS